MGFLVSCIGKMEGVTYAAVTQVKKVSQAEFRARTAARVAKGAEGSSSSIMQMQLALVQQLPLGGRVGCSSEPLP